MADCFERLHIGNDGTLWASAPMVLPTDARRYTVFDTAGHAIARVEIPPRVQPFRMSRERIVGTFTDDDIPYVMRWRLRAIP